MSYFQSFIKSKYFNIISQIILIASCLTVFGYWQASSNFADPDAFYHMKMGQLLWQRGIIIDFPWQQYTILKNDFVDHHLLYHYLLVPFVNLINPLIGIKIAVVLLATLFVYSFVSVGKKIFGKQAIWIGYLIIATIPFTFRLNLVKANALSLVIIFLGIYFAYRYKYWLIFLLSWIYVWSYGGFIMLIGIVGLWALIDMINSKKIIKNCFLVASNWLGILCGIIINPYFPKNLQFYWQQIVQIGIINYQDKIGVGGEWYPYGFVELITGCSILSVLLFISLLIFFITIKKQKAINWFSLLLFIVGLLLVLKSRRYIEYYVPFGYFFVLSSLSVFWLAYKEKIIYFVKNFWQSRIINKAIFFVICLAFSLLIPAIIVQDFLTNTRDLRSGSSYKELSKASTWLKQNTPPGSIVLHSDWDEWPLLFYNNENNYYIVGLDPTFMYNYNQELYWSWVNITIGSQKEKLPKIIGEQFHAQYVFLTKDHTSLDYNIQQFPAFKLVYEDEEVKIYQLES